MQRALDELHPGLEIVDTTAHDWLADEFARGTWAIHRPGWYTRHHAAMREPESGLVFAGSDLADGWSGFVDGAIESGLRAARQVQALLTPKLTDFEPMSAPGHTALGAWSGGRYMHFGEPLDDDRFVRLLRPGRGHPHGRHGRRVRRGGGRPRGRAARSRGCRASRSRWSGRSATTSTARSATAPRGSRASPPETRPGEYAGYLREADRAQPRALRRRPLRRAAPAQPRPRRATRRPSSGRRWPVCARPVCATRSASLPGPPTASRSTSSAAWSASAT